MKYESYFAFTKRINKEEGDSRDMTFMALMSWPEKLFYGGIIYTLRLVVFPLNLYFSIKRYYKERKEL